MYIMHYCLIFSIFVMQNTKYKNMLFSCKDINKVQEIKLKFEESWYLPEFFSFYLKLFHFTGTAKFCAAIKRSGVKVWTLLELLLVLRFSNVNTLGGLYNSPDCNGVKVGKDCYYRLLSLQNIKWRSLMFLFVKRYLKLESKFEQKGNSPRCLIFDDTDIEKKGLKIEGISKTFNHVTRSYIFGYKLLLAGYWNGSVFIPVDFSFHRENKKNKKNKYGLTAKQRKAQKSTFRTKGSPALKRFEELNKKKTDMLVAMFKRIAKRQIDVDYILMDSWFTSISLIKRLRAVNRDVHVVGMYKYNSKIKIDEKERSIKQLKQAKAKMSYSRKTGMYYMSYTGKIEDEAVQVFLIRRGRRGAWHTIVSTHIGLSFSKMMEIYSVRWTIEVFFKEAKQLLGLGKCRSTNFDVQVAQTTITMMQYIILSLKFRIEAYETLGGVFRHTKQEYIEYKLNERIMGVIAELLQILEDWGIDINCDVILRKLINYSENTSLIFKKTKKGKPPLLAG